MPPKIAGIIKLINHKIIVAANISRLLMSKLENKNNARFPLNPKSINAMLNGLMVCRKNIVITKINTRAMPTFIPNK